MSTDFTSGVGGYSYGNYQTSQLTGKDQAANTKVTEQTAGAEGEVEKLDPGAVYEKEQKNTGNSGIYSGKTMSETDRTNLINKLKADQASHQSQLVKIAEQLISGQTKAFGLANAGDESNNIWNFLRKGEYTVDAETKQQAQEDISEDGYYGVKQTSQRLFDFAKALSGGDMTKMQEMQSAIEKGYKQAEETWGGELPEISKNTLDATNNLFEEYYKTAGVSTGA